MIDRIISNLEERRERILNGEVNCIPSSFTRFRDDFVGVEQGKDESRALPCPPRLPLLAHPL